MFISLRITVGMCNVYLTEIYCNIEMVYSITDTSKSLFFCKYELFFIQRVQDAVQDRSRSDFSKFPEPVK